MSVGPCATCGLLPSHCACAAFVPQCSCAARTRLGLPLPCPTCFLVPSCPGCNAAPGWTCAVGCPRGAAPVARTAGGYCPGCSAPPGYPCVCQAPAPLHGVVIANEPTAPRYRIHLVSGGRTLCGIETPDLKRDERWVEPRQDDADDCNCDACVNEWRPR